MADKVMLSIDGVSVAALAGESLGIVLSRQAPGLRQSPVAGSPRGMFCGMGLCFECMVEVDGIAARACLVRVRDHMRVATGRGGAA